MPATDKMPILGGVQPRWNNGKSVAGANKAPSYTDSIKAIGSLQGHPAMFGGGGMTSTESILSDVRKRL